MTRQEILHTVERQWDKEVEAGCGYTVPALALTRELIQEYIAGRRDDLPGLEGGIEPRHLLIEVEGKDVLCLASGGGQQSAAFGLLGARVTVLDLCEGQLRGDQMAAQHYGYSVSVLKGTMDDLSAFANASFDLVCQPISICFVPDVRPVYQEVHRVLRPGGRYAVSHCSPATLPTSLVGGANGWDGFGYRIAERYRGGSVYRNEAGVENMEAGEPIGEYRHLLKDIFGGLLESGFVIEDVREASRHFREPVGEPGSYSHSLSYVGAYFGILVRKASG